MGWFDSDHPGHEGYAVAFVEHERSGGGILRELGYPDDKAPRSDIREVSAACECGWRSPRWKPLQLGTHPEWHPFAAFLSDQDEDRVQSLWRRHLSEVSVPAGRESDGW